MKKPLRIGNAQAFWGDSPDAPARLVQQQPDLDYLTLDYLAEVSMSIMAIQKEKDIDAGYAKDFVDVIRSLIPFWKKGSQVKIVTNAGGLNPVACAVACKNVLEDAKLPKKIGVVQGDNVLDQLLSQSDRKLYQHLETGKSLHLMKDKLVTANAYFGAKPISDLLLEGADIVITGRTADPSLTVAPCVAYFGWNYDNYNLIAQATIAGHLIECGTQVTGGISTNWLSIPDKANIGFPVVEMESDGSFVVTKPKNTGGIVNEETIKEQLLYEIGDPSRYLSPDATVSFLTIHLESCGDNRVRITGAKGAPPPKTYKVSATYRDGYRSEAFLAIAGPEAAKKAKICGEIILEHVKRDGFTIERSLVESLGCGDLMGIVGTGMDMECIMRITVADHSKEALERFSKEIASLVTSGSQGVTGYSSGRPSVRPIFGFWPCLIEREKVLAKTHIYPK